MSDQCFVATASDDLVNGIVATIVKRAFNSYMRKHLVNTQQVVGTASDVRYTPREVTTSNPKSGVTAQTIKDNAKSHDHYLAGAVEFFKSYGITPDVRNAMCFGRDGKRMKQYGSYPTTTHVTALLHPVTKKHLMSVVAQYGGPYAKVSNTWGKDYGHYYDNLGDDGWPQGYWGGKK